MYKLRIWWPPYHYEALISASSAISDNVVAARWHRKSPSKIIEYARELGIRASASEHTLALGPEVASS